MESSQQTVVIKLLMWLWTALLMGSLALSFFEHLADTKLVLFLIAPVSLPVIVMDSLFHGPATISLAMFLAVLIAAIELGFILYNSIQLSVEGENYTPMQDTVVPFVLALLFALGRFILALSVVTFLAKIRLVPFSKRCNSKPHKF